MKDEKFLIKRRHLPHWRLIGSTYFVTFRTKDIELTVDEQKSVLEHIIGGDKIYYSLIGAVVMPDHTHIILKPKGDYDLSRIMKGIKGVSARIVNSMRNVTGHIWLNEYFDRIIRDENELLEKLNYMLNNPLKQNLTENPWEYHGWYYNQQVEY